MSDESWKFFGFTGYVKAFMEKNVTISFKHEYRRYILTSQRDVMNIKNTFYVIICYVLYIPYVKMNLSQIFRNIQNGRHFEVFKQEVVPEVESNNKIGRAIPYIWRFCLTF